MAKRPRKSKLRSGFEDKIVQALSEADVDFGYETLKIKYQKKPSVYTPDIVLGNGVIIEIKGYFDAEDRAKHLLVKEQNPEHDIRFVFYDSRKKIHKNSSTTYADWATKHGFLYYDKTIPDAWIQEGQPKRPKTRRKSDN